MCNMSMQRRRGLKVAMLVAAPADACSKNILRLSRKRFFPPLLVGDVVDTSLAGTRFLVGDRQRFSRASVNYYIPGIVVASAHLWCERLLLA